MRMTRYYWIVPALVVVLGAGRWAGAQSERDLRPEVGQLVQSVAEKLESVGDKLGLTDDQRAKIRDIHATFAEKYKDQRMQRRALRQKELEAMNPILTSAQRDKVENFVEDRVETAREN